MGGGGGGGGGGTISAMLLTRCPWTILFLIPQKLKQHHGFSGNNTYPQLKIIASSFMAVEGLI